MEHLFRHLILGFISIISLNNCSSSIEKKEIPQIESHQDSTLLCSLQTFVKKNINWSIDPFGNFNRGGLKHYLHRMDEEEGIRGEHIFINKVIEFKSLKLRLYDIHYRLKLPFIHFNILENIETGFKCTLPIWNKENLYKGPSTFYKVDYGKRYNMIGLERQLNNSSLDIMDLDIMDLESFFNYSRFGTTTFDSTYGNVYVKQQKHLDKIKKRYLNIANSHNQYYTPQEVEVIFNHLNLIINKDRLVSSDLESINIIYYINHKIHLLQIKAPKFFEYYNEYNFIVEYYVF